MYIGRLNNFNLLKVYYYMKKYYSKINIYILHHNISLELQFFRQDTLSIRYFRAPEYLA